MTSRKITGAISVSICLVAGASSQAANDADRHVMQYCAGLFDAREKWLDVMDPEDGYGEIMASNRDLLLSASQHPTQSPPAQQRYESKTGRFEEYSLSMLTHLADKGEITTCSQDPLCLACSEILPLVQKLSDQKP